MPDDKVWEEIRHAYEHTSIPVKELQATYNVSEADFRKRREVERWTTRSGLTAMLKAGAAQRAAAKLAAANFVATTDQEPVQEPVTETPKPQPTAATATTQPTPASRRNHAGRKAPTSANRKAVITRLSTAIDNKLVTLEARMARELSTIDNIDETSAADIERDIRAIGQLIKNLEQATAHEATVQNKGPGASRSAAGRGRRRDASATELADEADRSRRELLDRLQRLVDAAQKEASEDPGSPAAG